jgi:hypothetical protein
MDDKTPRTQKLSPAMFRALDDALAVAGPPVLLRTGGKGHVDGMTRKALRERKFVEGEHDTVTEDGRGAHQAELDRQEAAKQKAQNLTTTPTGLPPDAVVRTAGN